MSWCGASARPISPRLPASLHWKASAPAGACGSAMAGTGCPSAISAVPAISSAMMSPPPIGFARDLHVGVELVPINWETLEARSRGRAVRHGDGRRLCDAGRLRTLSVSEFYIANPVAFIVRAGRVSHLTSFADIAAQPDLRLGVFQDPVLVPLAQALFPKAKLTVLASYDELPSCRLSRPRSGPATRLRPGPRRAPALPRWCRPIWARRCPVLSAAAALVRHAALCRPLAPARAGERRARGALDYWVKGVPRAVPGQRWNLIDSPAAAWPGQ